MDSALASPRDLFSTGLGRICPRRVSTYIVRGGFSQSRGLGSLRWEIRGDVAGRRWWWFVERSKTGRRLSMEIVSAAGRAEADQQDSSDASPISSILGSLSLHSHVSNNYTRPTSCIQVQHPQSHKRFKTPRVEYQNGERSFSLSDRGTYSLSRALSPKAAQITLKSHRLWLCDQVPCFHDEHDLRSMSESITGAQDVSGSSLVERVSDDDQWRTLPLHYG